MSQQLCFATVYFWLDVGIWVWKRLHSILSPPFDTLDEHDESIVGCAKCTQESPKTCVWLFLHHINTHTRIHTRIRSAESRGMDTATLTYVSSLMPVSYRLLLIAIHNQYQSQSLCLFILHSLSLSFQFTNCSMFTVCQAQSFKNVCRMTKHFLPLWSPFWCLAKCSRPWKALQYLQLEVLLKCTGRW